MKEHRAALLSLSLSSVRSLCVETGGLCFLASLGSEYSVSDPGVGQTQLSSEMVGGWVELTTLWMKGTLGGSWEAESDGYRKMGAPAHDLLPTPEGT